jgi:hypothetical protein
MAIGYLYHKVITPEMQWHRFHYQRSFFIKITPLIMSGRFLYRETIPMQCGGGKRNKY